MPSSNVRKNTKVTSTDPAIDLAIFVKTMAISLQAGLDLLSFAQMFAVKCSDNKLGRELCKVTESGAPLKMETLLDVLRKYPHSESTLVAGTLQCGDETGASISGLLEDHLDFISIKTEKFSKLNESEKVQMWFFLRIVSRAICAGMNIVQAWEFAGRCMVTTSTCDNWIASLIGANPAELVQNIKQVSQKKNDRFLGMLAFVFELLFETGGDLSNFLEWMASNIRSPQRC